MEYNCKINVVDAIMGGGKSSAAINYINNAEGDEKFLYITPYISEVNRIQEACRVKDFCQPDSNKSSSKLRHIQRLISKGRNIASTHALFHLFDDKVIELCRSQNYTLIMDEVTDVIETYDISGDDMDVLERDFFDFDEATGLISWRESRANYKGEYENIKRLCDMGCLARYGGKIVVCLFPVQVFTAFHKIYILTYMFGAQPQKLYYDFHGLTYNYIYVKGDSHDNYEFTDEKVDEYIKYDYRKLIHIVENEKMNQVGKKKGDLSKSWYTSNKEQETMLKLKKNVLNFFNNICDAKSEDCLWTTFKNYFGFLKGKGYTKGFLSLGCRATNKYRDRTCVAYIVNKFMNPVIRQFFVTRGVTVDEDKFALSEMLQFIWRSAVRDGEEITVYVPSSRMRNLLKQWIAEVGEQYDKTHS